MTTHLNQRNFLWPQHKLIKFYTCNFVQCPKDIYIHAEIT